MDTSYAVFCGIDVGKSEHQAVGLDSQGTRLYDKALPNDETRVRAVFDQLATHGPILIVVISPTPSAHYHHRRPRVRPSDGIPTGTIDAPHR